MTGTRRLLLVVGCVVCLLAVASALPAADPRLSPAGGDGGEPGAGEWGAIEERPSLSGEPPRDADRGGNDRDGEAVDDPEIEIRGAIEPGNEVRVEIDSASPFDERTVEVNGDPVGETDWGRIDVAVPYAEEMTVSVPDEDLSRTVDVETNATIRTHDGAVPTGEFEISAAVGATPIRNATVSVDGAAVATTDEDGYATVRLPETAGPVELSVERGPVEGSRTVDVAEPRVAFVSPLLFPGSPAPVQVSADGTAVPNATVSIEGGDAARTGDDGRTHVWLPIDDEATVTATVGEETATATVENLYLRLGSVAVLVPGLVIGAAVTYVRLFAARKRRRGAVFDGLFVSLAGFLAGLSDAFGGLSGGIAAVAGSLSGLLDRLGGVRAPSLPLPSVGAGWRAPSIAAAASSLGRALGSVSALASLGGSSARSRGSILGRSRLGGVLGSGDPDEPDDDGASAGLAAEPYGPRGPRAEIRAAWHAFLDRLDVGDRETTTPGGAARRALAAGFPADRVARLVSIVRDVEYGGRPPTPDRIAEAREAAAELIDSEPDEEGST